MSNLEEEKALKVAKNSLINEIVKEKELIKIFDLGKNISYLDQVMKDYTSIKFEKSKEFSKLLKNKNTYSIDEIKKLKIELLWNELIKKFNNQVKIDENQLIKKIYDNNQIQNEYFI